MFESIAAIDSNIIYTDNTALLEAAQIDNDGHQTQLVVSLVKNNEDYLGKVSKLCHGAPGDG